MLASLKVSDRNIIRIYEANEWEVSRVFLYEVLNSDTLIFDARIAFLYADPAAGRPDFSLVRSGQGQLVAVVADDYPDSLLILHDFSTNESWPDSVDFNEHSRETTGRGLTLLGRFNTALPDKGYWLNTEKGYPPEKPGSRALKTNISKTGNLTWEITTNRGSDIEVVCHIFPASAAFEEKFNSKLALRNEILEHYRELLRSYKDERVRLEAQKGIDELEIKMDNFVGSWPAWRMVMVWNTGGAESRAGVMFSKYVLICRHEKEPFDLAFVAYIPGKIKVTEKALVLALRDLTKEFEKLSAIEWAELPKKTKAIVDEEGYFTEELLPDRGTTSFPQQH